MAVDRALWTEKFTDQLPHWPCPTCNKGHLAPMQDKYWIEETGPSLAEHGHDAWDPDWIQNRFTCFLQCSLPACGEVAVVAGSSGIDYYQIDWDEYKTSEIFNVRAIVPAPEPISIPDNTPRPIVDAIRRASALIWMSAESAANQIRQAVEYLLDDAGIPRTGSNGKPIHLHQRITQFQATDEENGNVLLATKWLGNVGSHGEGLARDDVLDAFDMIEFVLENRYATTKASLMAKVAAVIAAKGPAAKP